MHCGEGAPPAPPTPPPLLTTRSSKWRNCDGEAEDRTVILLILSSAVTQRISILTQETIYFLGRGGRFKDLLCYERTRKETHGGNFTAHCPIQTLGWNYGGAKNTKEPSENPSPLPPPRL